MVLVVNGSQFSYNKVMIHYIRLPLEGTVNTRDLGGYPTKEGHSTKWHVFLRSDDLVLLSEKDQQFLWDYGLRTVIDLRSLPELMMRPSPYIHHPQIAYHNVSLFEKANPKTMEALPEDLLKSMYVEMLTDHQDQLKEIMTLIAHAPEGAVLFHCAAGKDRTGIIAMLLLGLVRVAHRDIVSNYEVSFTNLKRNAYYKKNKDMYTHLMFSSNTTMEDTLGFIRERYKTIEDYLLSIGLTQETLDQIKGRFLIKNPL